MSNLLSWQFWFDPTPVVMSNPFMWGFFSLFAAMLLGSLAARIYIKNSVSRKDVRDIMFRAVNAFLVVGLLGFVWLFFTYEEVQIFAYRVWVVVLFAVLIGYLVSLYRFARVEIPRKAQLASDQANLQKYLPRRNR